MVPLVGEDEVVVGMVVMDEEDLLDVSVVRMKTLTSGRSSLAESLTEMVGTGSIVGLRWFQD